MRSSAPGGGPTAAKGKDPPSDTVLGPKGRASRVLLGLILHLYFLTFLSNVFDLFLICETLLPSKTAVCHAVPGGRNLSQVALKPNGHTPKAHRVLYNRLPAPTLPHQGLSLRPRGPPEKEPQPGAMRARGGPSARSPSTSHPKDHPRQSHPRPHAPLSHDCFPPITAHCLKLPGLAVFGCICLPRGGRRG